MFRQYKQFQTESELPIAGFSFDGKSNRGCVLSGGIIVSII